MKNLKTKEVRMVKEFSPTPIIVMGVVTFIAYVVGSMFFGGLL